jgi:radical SAM protein with 4Fe4S-binding SPASM domain
MEITTKVDEKSTDCPQDAYADAQELKDLTLWDRLQQKRLPISFDLEITARCNNNCRHCYINLPSSDAGAKSSEMTLAEIESIADQAVELGTLWCLITGGEPLLRPDFKEIYLALRRKGLLVSVFTNATIITPKHIRLFRDVPPRDIEVTVYGVSEATYDRVTRTPGSYERFMRGLDELLEAGIPIRLKAMAMKSNAHEFEKIASFCRQKTKDYFRFDPQLHLRYDGNPQRNDEIMTERLTPVEIVALEQSDPDRIEGLLKNCEELLNAPLPPDGYRSVFRCAAGSNNFTVGYDGRFRICASLRAPGTTYDLREGTLAEAWRDFVPRVRAMSSDRRAFLDGCYKCSLAQLCYWCPAHAHLESGALDGDTPYFCAVAHERAAMLGSHL